jgi:D-3-phosphoglycerate dehydrogenase
MTSAVPKTLILAPFDPVELKHLERTTEVFYESWTETRRLISPEELVERVQVQDIPTLVIEADFVFEEVFEEADKLRFLGVCRGAVDNINVGAATQHGVLVVNTPGRNAVSVAELTVGLIISLARSLTVTHIMVKSGEWVDPVGPYISMRGIEIANKVAGIIGLGAVGLEVAERLRAFGMNILVYDPYVNTGRVDRVGAKQVELDELMRDSDFITLHCTASPETTGLLDEYRLGLMKPTSFVINTARWEIVKADALIDALRHKRIAGAAFDVYETHPVPRTSALLDLDNVILTPHLGGATDGAVSRHSRMISEDIIRFLNGVRPLNLVNPEVWIDRGR